MPYPKDRRKHQPDVDDVRSHVYPVMPIASEVGPGHRGADRARPAVQGYGRRKDDLPMPPDQDGRRQDPPT